MYLNLPYDDIIKEEIMPTLLFSKDLKNASAKGNNYLNDMLNLFEQKKDKNNRLANIILLKVPNQQREYSSGSTDDC